MESCVDFLYNLDLSPFTLPPYPCISQIQKQNKERKNTLVIPPDIEKRNATKREKRVTEWLLVLVYHRLTLLPCYHILYTTCIHTELQSRLCDIASACSFFDSPLRLAVIRPRSLPRSTFDASLIFLVDRITNSRLIYLTSVWCENGMLMLCLGLHSRLGHRTTADTLRPNFIPKALRRSNPF
jgi:hypothetical protein